MRTLRRMKDKIYFCALIVGHTIVSTFVAVAFFALIVCAKIYNMISGKDDAPFKEYLKVWSDTFSVEHIRNYFIQVWRILRNWEFH